VSPTARRRGREDAANAPGRQACSQGSSAGNHIEFEAAHTAKRKGNLRPWLSVAFPGLFLVSTAAAHTDQERGERRARWGGGAPSQSGRQASTGCRLASCPITAGHPKLTRIRLRSRSPALPLARPGGSPLSYYPRRTSLSNGRTAQSNLTSPNRPAIVPPANTDIESGLTGLLLHHGDSHGLVQARQCRRLLRAGDHGRALRRHGRFAVRLRHRVSDGRRSPGLGRTQDSIRARALTLGFSVARSTAFWRCNRSRTISTRDIWIKMVISTCHRRK
jgi:hypothetical protein